MKIMQDTNNGIYYSRKRFRVKRNRRNFFGTRQHGLPEFKIANLFKDIEMLKISSKCCNKNRIGRS